MKKAAFCLMAGLCAAVATTAPVLAQGRLFTDAAKAQWSTVSGYVLQSAELMPEADYAFKPTPEVRSFGQLIGHIADANQGICAMAIGEKRDFGTAEKTKTTKADLVAALKESATYCDGAFAKINDTTGAETVPVFGSEMPKVSAMAFNTNHVWEHYGNIVTYMRLKKMVPPSSR
jgi:uncharacterized damage-inducible protein DinB